MVVLPLSSYIDFAKNIKKRTDDTITNYENAMKYTGVKEIDTDNLDPLFKSLIDKLDNKVPYGYIQNILKVIRATLKLHGHKNWTRGYNYNVLVGRLAQSGSVPDAYAESEVRIMIHACQSDPGLFKLMMLCTYALLRIGGCEGLAFSKFKRMPNGVYVFPVHSKERDYIAAISEYAFNWLRKMNYPESDIIVPFDVTAYKTDFEDLYRKRLKYRMKSKGIGYILKGKQPWHGFRKFATNVNNTSKLEEDEKSLLLGQIPETTANVHYVTDIETFGPKVAEIYAKSQLNTLRLVE